MISRDAAARQVDAEGGELRLGVLERVERLLAAAAGDQGRRGSPPRPAAASWCGRRTGCRSPTRMVAAAICASGETSRIGQRHDRHALGRGVARRLDRGAGIGLDARRQQDVARGRHRAARRGRCRRHRPASPSCRRAATACSGSARRRRGRSAGPGNRCAAPRAGGRRHRPGGRALRARRGARSARSDCAMSAASARSPRSFCASTCTPALPAKPSVPAAHRAGIELAHLVVAFEAEPLGEPRHGGGRHAGAARLLAHRQQRHVVGTVEHVARGGLQLRGQRVEQRDDPVGEGPLIHGRFAYAFPWLIATLVSFYRI